MNPGDIVRCRDIERSGGLVWNKHYEVKQCTGLYVTLVGHQGRSWRRDRFEVMSATHKTYIEELEQHLREVQGQLKLANASYDKAATERDALRKEVSSLRAELAKRDGGT